MLGYSPEEWIGIKGFWQNRIHPEDRERAISFCFSQTEKGENHTFEYRMRKADGDYIWLRDVVTVVKEVGEATTLRGLMIDIDQEKLLELKLEMAYELAKIGSWELNLVNDNLYWSKYIKELHEVDNDYQPNLESAIDFYTEGWSRDTISKVVENTIITGEPFDVELPIETAKGNERWIRAVGKPEFIDDTCVRVYGSTQDITERIEAEQGRVKILESISDAFYALDSDWNFTYINQEAEKMLKRRAVDLLDKNIWEEFPVARQSEVYEIYKEVAESGKPRHFEYYYQPLEIWVDISVNSNKDGLSVFFRNINDRKRSEESLKTLNNELMVSNTELEQFAFVVSHDLQEPLRMITGFLGQLDKKYDHLLDEKGKKYIHFATDGANRMKQIILDLLEYSRVGRVDMEREEINMNDLVHEALLLNRKLITEIKADVNVEKLPIINAMKVPMRQLFQNLINNSIKYHKKDRKPNVNITAGEDEDFWYFEIEDNGIGIVHENTAKIFILFQRLHNKEEYSG
ncbi:MAG: PAS domain S-box protein, partial [Cyclobacteriaceae bacterium]